MLETITSIKDEKITLARAIKSRKGRQDFHKILLEGEEILDWAIENAVGIEFILASDKTSSNITGKYLSRNHKVFVVSEGILKKVTDTNYVIPIVSVAINSFESFESMAPFVVVLDSVRDFGNIGTIIRTCHAFGIRDVISTTNDFDIYQRKTIEASRGSVFTTHLKRFQSETETIEYLKKQGYQIVATSPKGSDLQSLVELRRQPVALVVGNETTGISSEFEKQADLLVQIPMSHTVESLNVGVATGISIYELKLKQVLTMIEEQIKSTLGRELNVAGMLVQEALDAELRKVSELSSRQVIFMMVLKCDGKISLEDLRKIRMPISPKAYMDKLRGTNKKTLLVHALYDYSFPHDLSLEVLKDFRERNLRHSAFALYCGHYTSGEFPFNIVLGLKMCGYIKRNL